MTLLAVHPLALPLTVFGLVLTLWLLGLLVVDSRKQRMRVEVAAPEKRKTSVISVFPIPHLLSIIFYNWQILSHTQHIGRL